MTYDSAFEALGDATRRRLFETLAKGPQSVGALARDLPVSRPAVSQHLKVLSDAGLVDVQSAGTKRIYSVRREGLAQLRAYLDQFWGDVLQSFAEEIEKERESDA